MSSRDILYGRQGGSVVPSAGQEALEAIARARDAAGARWPAATGQGMTEAEWRSAAAFARISEALGRPLTAKEREAIRRYPDEPAAGTNMRGDPPPDAAPAPAPQPDPPRPLPSRGALRLLP